MSDDLRLLAHRYLEVSDSLRAVIAETAWRDGYAAFSERFGLTGPTLSRMRSGSQWPTRKHAEAIVSVLMEPEPEPEPDLMQTADYLRWQNASIVADLRKRSDEELSDLDRARIDLHDYAERVLAGGGSQRILESKQRHFEWLSSEERE